MIPAYFPPPVRASLLEPGVGALCIGEVLGHHSAAITQGIYQHVRRDRTSGSWCRLRARFSDRRNSRGTAHEGPTANYQGDRRDN